MLWIDDVIDDLKLFCDDHGYLEISAKLDETRKIYHQELQEKYLIESTINRSSETKRRSIDRFSETVSENKRDMRLVISKQ